MTPETSSAVTEPLLTLAEIETAIRHSWSSESCDPSDLEVWTMRNSSRGQCAVTALVVHDLLGGEILEAEVLFTDGTRQGFHYWNRLNGFELDMTRDQFGTDEQVQRPHVIEGSTEVPWLAHDQYLAFRSHVYELLGLTDTA